MECLVSRYFAILFQSQHAGSSLCIVDVLTDYQPLSTPLVMHWGMSSPWNEQSPKNHKVEFREWAESGWSGRDISDGFGDVKPSHLTCDLARPGPHGGHVTLSRASVGLPPTQVVTRGS